MTAPVCHHMSSKVEIKEMRASDYVRVVTDA
jgi:hypothetical protein